MMIVRKRFLSCLMILCISCENSIEDEERALIAEEEIVDVSTYLTIDLNNLDEYSNQSFPVYYNQLLNNTNTPVNNSITNEGATLGRVLFYDKQLSINNTVSCASCHKQENAFTDTVQFSIGFNGIDVTEAHSMRLLNAQFYEGEQFFWDKRAPTLEAQVTLPIQNEVEMGFDSNNGGISALISKMNNIPYYNTLFEFVYGDEEITEERIQFALAQFIRSMSSVSSKFDDGYRQVYAPNIPNGGLLQNFPNYSEIENLGKQLFITAPNQGGAGCIACHQAPSFALNATSRSNGLDIGETTIFKSASLKNISNSRRFMHDGRFSSLAEVIDHYNDGIENGPALDNRLKDQQGNPLRLNLTQEEKEALEAFMLTLTDQDIIIDDKFSSPFINN